MRSSKMLYRVFASVFSQLAREIIGHFASVENAQILKQYIVLPKAAAKDEIKLADGKAVYVEDNYMSVI